MKPRKQPAFYEEHRISFAKYDAAKAYFDAHSMAKKLPSVKKLQTEIDSLVSERNDVITAYCEKHQRAKELDTLYSSIQRIQKTSMHSLHSVWNCAAVEIQTFSARKGRSLKPAMQRLTVCS